MTEREELLNTLNKRPRPETAYDVGYGKPPKETRFKKGQSGNPGGRPKGSKNRKAALGEDPLRALILREANRKVPVREGDRTKIYTMAEAVMRTVSANAVRGQPRAQKLFVDILTKAQQAETKDQRDLFEAAVGYKRFWTRELDERKRAGRKGPEPFPHPDDVIIDPRAGTVTFKGPMTKEEKEILDFLIEREQAWVKSVEQLQHDLKDEKMREYWDMLKKDLQSAKNEVKFLRECIAERRGEPEDAIDIVRLRKEFKVEMEKRQSSKTKSPPEET